MSRLDAVASRYIRSAALARNGVELDLVGDPYGARVNTAIQQLLLLTRDDSSALWGDVFGAAKALRWRLLTQPQPLERGSAIQTAATDVASEAGRLRAAVDPQAQRALDELADSAGSIAAADPIAGSILLESIQEATARACVIIAASASAKAGLETWLGPLGFRVMSASQLIREQLFVESGYAVGPPRFFPASLVNAPMTEMLNFVFPAWFGDRSLPRSVLAAHAEGAVVVTGRQFPIGDVAAPVPSPARDVIDETDLLPQVSWIPPDTPPREPGPDEVAARRMLLSGGFKMWLDDDGDWIRSVDPAQPSGGRVINIDVDAVRPGTYLLVRDGETERLALYEAALQLMGFQAVAVVASQSAWKAALQAKLDQLGPAVVVRELAAVGVKTLHRIAAWTDPMLARPLSNQDFERLLQWLGVKVHPTYELATLLRRSRAQASAKIGDKLEEAVAAADMSILELDGHLRLELKSEGFRGMIATRVLSVSPYVEIISRHDARQLTPDRSAKWLE